MTISSRSVGLGVLAGLAAALLSIGIIVQSGLAIVLSFLAPLPIFIAALGWGTLAGIVAAATTSLAVGLIASPFSGLAVGLVTALPAAVCAHMAGLARPAHEIGGKEGELAWFPISGILWRITLMAAAVTIIIGIFIGFGAGFVHEMSRATVSMFAKSDPTLHMDKDTAGKVARFLLAVLPISSSALMVLTLAGNLYAGLRLTALSGRLARPRDDWPAALRMPPAAVVVFVPALALAFAPGGTGHAAAAVAGALGAGFLLSGFAAFHFRTRGSPWRLFALWLAYIATAFFGFVALFFVIAGLLEALPFGRTKGTAAKSD